MRSEEREDRREAMERKRGKNRTVKANRG